METVSEFEYCYIYGYFRIILYLILLILAFPILIIKWYNENPRRAVRIWWFDTSKTLIGYIILNAFPTYYFIANTEILEDINRQYCRITFMGTILDGVLVTCFTYFFQMVFENWSIQSQRYKFVTGIYKSPNAFKSWSYQLWVWLLTILISKLLVIGVIYLFYVPLYFLTYFILYLVSWNFTLEKVVILLLAPLIQNIIVFYANVS